MFTNEYETLLKCLVFNTDGQYDFADCIQKAHGKHFITHGDSFLCEKTGNILCSSPVLTGQEDSKSNQALDYIFQVRTHAKLQDASCY